MAMNIKHDYVVYGGMGAALAYLFFELWPKADNPGWSKLIPIAALAIAGFYFHKHYIDLDKVEKVSPVEVGPEQPFISSPQEWDFDSDGKPIKRFKPPKVT